MTGSSASENVGGGGGMLCFNRELFTRADEFNVESFLNSMRRRASIERVQVDLRTYLKLVQNSMIELINEDYQDFVNLSSNLVNVRAGLEKVSADVDEVLLEFEASTRPFCVAVEQLTDIMVEKRRLAVEQGRKESVVRLHRIVGKIEDLLSNFVDRSANEQFIRRMCRLFAAVDAELRARPADGKYSGCFSVEFAAKLSHLKDAFQWILDRELVRAVEKKAGPSCLAVLSAYWICGRGDAACAVFMAEFLEPNIRRCLRSNPTDVVEKLKSVLVELEEANADLAAKLTEALHCDDGSADLELIQVNRGSLLRFISTCCLTTLVSALETDFSEVVVPTEAALFHRCFTMTADFSHRWQNELRRKSTRASSDPDTDSLLRMASEKFNLAIYFHLCSLEINEMLEKALPARTTENKLVVERAKRGSFCQGEYEFQFEASSAVYAATKRCWNKQIFLQPLVTKFWLCTTKLLDRYVDFVDCFFNSVDLPSGTESAKGAEGVQACSTEVWQMVLDLVADVHVVSAALLDTLRTDIGPNILQSTSLRQLDKFEEHLTELSTRLRDMSSAPLSGVAQALAGAMISSLSAVAEVPRQYRWTRRAPPTEASAYLSGAFSPYNQFIESADKVNLPFDLKKRVSSEVLTSVSSQYSASVRDVVDSVEKMSTSLNRLKRSGAASSGTNALDSRETAAGGGGGAADTDDDKIRLQINLDVTKFSQLLNEAAGKFGEPSDDVWQNGSADLQPPTRRTANQSTTTGIGQIQS